jgi:hypothetical protein
MKTIKKLQAEIENMEKSFPVDYKLKKGEAEYLDGLRKLVLLLEKGVTEKYIQSEAEKLEILLDKLEDYGRYERWLKTNKKELLGCKNPRAIYSRENALRDKNFTLRMLNYLLS